MMGVYEFAIILLAQCLFLGLYQYYLSKHSFFGLHRWYLLSTLVASILLPFLASEVEQLSVFTTVASIDAHHAWVEVLSTPYNVSQTAVEKQGAVVNMFAIFYWSIVFVLLFKTTRSLWKLYLPTAPIGQDGTIQIKGKQAYSFFDKIYLPAQLDREERELVLAHEQLHERYGHSWDRLFLEYTRCFLWFLPSVYWYRRLLIQVHEYQVDHHLMRTLENPLAYISLLQQQCLPASLTGVSQFQSFFKNRIIMLSKKESNPSIKWRFLLGIPLFLGLLFINMISAQEQKSTTVEVVHPKEETTEDKYRPSIFPIDKLSKFKLTSHYGIRKHPVHKMRKMHTGVDLAASTGTTVVASADGVVDLVDNKHPKKGKYIIIRHGDTYETLYSHMSHIDVVEGQKVVQGQKIGEVGSSGAATGPHLHYEVFVDGKHVDPIDYLPIL